MTIKNIVVDKHAERLFIRRALRRLPREYLQVVIGYIDRHGTAFICMFLDIDHKATPTTCEYDHEDLYEHAEDAKESKLQYLGTVHSHPDLDHTLFSQSDLDDCQSTDDLIMGILAIAPISEGKRRKCTISYWPVPRPLETYYPDEG